MTQRSRGLLGRLTTGTRSGSPGVRPVCPAEVLPRLGRNRRWKLRIVVVIDEMRKPAVVAVGWKLRFVVKPPKRPQQGPVFPVPDVVSRSIEDHRLAKRALERFIDVVFLCRRPLKWPTPALVVRQNAVDYVAVLLALDRVDADRAPRVDLPRQVVAVFELGVRGAISEPALEDSGTAFDLVPVFQVGSHCQTTCPGMRAPVVWSVFVCGDEGAPVFESLCPHSAQPRSEFLVVAWGQFDEVRGENVRDEFTSECERVAGILAADDRGARRDYLIAILPIARPQVDERFRECSDVIPIVLICKICGFDRLVRFLD